MHLAMLERRRNHLSEKTRENVPLCIYWPVVLKACTQHMQLKKMKKAGHATVIKSATSSAV